jgi:hypothetical protein
VRARIQTQETGALQEFKGSAVASGTVAMLVCNLVLNLHILCEHRTFAVSEVPSCQHGIAHCETLPVQTPGKLSSVGHADTYCECEGHRDHGCHGGQVCGSYGSIRVQEAS